MKPCPLRACANTSGPSSCSRRSFQPQPRRRASEQAAEHSLAYRERRLATAELAWPLLVFAPHLAGVRSGVNLPGEEGSP
jgi:hypothetical protein